MRSGRAEKLSGSACRDLVAIPPIVRPAALQIPGRRPSAAFLAQLIATADQAPQTRERRRAEPLEAARYYVTTAAAPAFTGGTTLHSM
jgi:hypothetical protein